MTDNEFNGNTGGSTLPDYYNFRNLLFTQWEELNNATVELRTCNKSLYKIYQKTWVRCYLKFFAQINDKSKLDNLKPEQQATLKKYYYSPELVNVKIATLINDYTRELMTNYGVFDLEGGDDDLW